MSKRRGETSFWWQAVLILLPVLILALVGFFFVRKDARMARSEAVFRAQGLAENLLNSFWNDWEVEKHAELVEFEIDTEGNLVQPQPGPGLLSPLTLEVRELQPEQARLWLAANQPLTNAKTNISNWTAFLASAPPKRFAAVAQYSLGLARLEAGQDEPAADCFRTVINRYPNSSGESGLRLADLARFRLLQICTKPGRLEDAWETSAQEFCSNIVTFPSALSGYLLTQASALAPTGTASALVAKWQGIMDEQDRARALFEAASSHLQQSTGQPFWFETREPVAVPSGERNMLYQNLFPATKEWLALPKPGVSNHVTIQCVSEGQLGWALKQLAERSRILPDYFGIGLQVAEKSIRQFAPDLRLWHREDYFGRAGGGRKKVISQDLSTEAMAEAIRKIPHGKEMARLTIYLTSPGTLYEAQQARRTWLTLLVVLSAGAALIGLYSAWRAFHRQIELNELKSNFVSSVSHELRAPIASVSLMAESLQRGKIATEARRNEYFHFISQECRRLSALIENVLDFSRMDQNRKTYEKEPTDLKALVRRTVQLMEPYASDRGVQLVCGPIVSCQSSVDPKAIQQALVNLIDNAIKHSPKDQPVTVGLEASGSTNSNPASPTSEPAAPSSVLKIWVEDHGPGIPTNEQQRIFERFYRLGSELRRETTGIGIGLSIVKHVVEEHGGRVVVRSAPGEGSRFTIELPLAGNHTASSAATQSYES